MSIDEERDESAHTSTEEEQEVEDNRLPCPTCGKKFWTQYYLKKHVARVHEKRYKVYVRVKKYACKYKGCGKAYTTPGKLKDHETVHTGNLLNENLCFKVFIGERPFDCGQCKKSFSGRATFANHLRREHQISIKDLEKIINL